MSRSAARLLVLLTGILLCHTAAADPIGPTGCTEGSCQGGIYTLEYDPTPVDTDGVAMTETWRITLSIDTTSLVTVPTAAVQVADVAVKIANTIIDGDLFSAPGGTGSWTEALGGLNANGCQANANNGFDCASANVGTVATLPFAGIYQWIFDIEVGVGDLLLAAGAASVKARFIDALGEKTGDLVSEPITLQAFPPIPEPQTLILLSSGLLGLALAGNRRRARS